MWSTTAINSSIDQLREQGATCIGRDVRCSPASHITSTHIADRVFLGVGLPLS